MRESGRDISTVEERERTESNAGVNFQIDVAGQPIFGRYINGELFLDNEW